MQLKLSTLSVWSGALLCVSTAVAAPADMVPNLVVFGNSMSDTGNAMALDPTLSHFDGRMSNSYLWDEYAAKLLGMQLVNRAYSGASTNNEFSPIRIATNATLPSLHDQVSMWLEKKPTKFHLDNDVIEIEIGSNDIFYHMGDLLSGIVDLPTLASSIAGHIAAEVDALTAAGYKNVFVWNLPSIEKAPLAATMGSELMVAPIISAVNTAIGTALAAGSRAQGVHMLDLHSLMNIALEPNVLEALAITDSTTACFDNVKTVDTSEDVPVCSNPDEHFFYDRVHPASRVHYLWGAIASIVTRDPSAVVGAEEMLALIQEYDIGQSNPQNNIITSGLPSGSSDNGQSNGVPVPTHKCQ
ncbi:hypothetical protein GGF46_004773 [Coemansia sp. RSA 552]|nr:hypothetical protein GGF46_004773 [Coemansia sp. RSA 552]